MIFFCILFSPSANGYGAKRDKVQLRLIKVKPSLATESRVSLSCPKMAFAHTPM